MSSDKAIDEAEKVQVFSIDEYSEVTLLDQTRRLCAPHMSSRAYSA